jgi:hypothetical protein
MSPPKVTPPPPLPPLPPLSYVSRASVAGTNAVLVYSGATLELTGYAANGNAVQSPVTIALPSNPSPAFSHILGPLLNLTRTKPSTSNKKNQSATGSRGRSLPQRTHWHFSICKSRAPRISTH